MAKARTRNIRPVRASLTRTQRHTIPHHQKDEREKERNLRMVVRKTYQIDARQLMEINSRIRLPCASDLFFANDSVSFAPSSP